MKTILLSALILLALPAFAAETSIPTVSAGTSATFVIPISVTLGSEHANVIEGSIGIPEGLIVDGITTGGGALTLYTNEPQYVVSDKAVTFTGGVPGGVTGDDIYLFSIRAHAPHPGTYLLTPTEFFLYRNDGKGTRVSLATSDVLVTVAEGNVKTPKTETISHRSSLIAEVGKDASLFDGKTFVTFFGGDDGSGVAYYLIREGWWNKAVVADRYHVLKDQKRLATIYLTAKNTDGREVVTTLPPLNPWPERGVTLAFFVVIGVVIGLVFVVGRLIAKYRP